MCVSDETIYQSLFVQGGGELRRELRRCLRSGRTTRRRQGRVEGRGRIPGMVMLAVRPAEADNRAVPGHWLNAPPASSCWCTWEMTRQPSTSRRPCAAYSSRSPTNSVVASRGTRAPRCLRTGPSRPRPGSRSTSAIPTRRGSEDRTRTPTAPSQFLPKGTELASVSAADLRRIQRSLNDRPRKTLGYMTPSEKLAQVVALTA